MGSRLNFACGGSRWPGWDNSDINGEPGVHHVDMRVFPYPYPDGSAEYVMISHGLMGTREGKPLHADLPRVLAEFRRVLAPGGWLRIDENPARVWVRDLDPLEDELDLARGYPAALRIAFDDFVDDLLYAGFDPVVRVAQDTTQIRCDPYTHLALTGNRMGHSSVCLEAQAA